MKKLLILFTALLALSVPAWGALGDSAADLVFTPVTPCRIFDTRTSQGGTGAIPAGGIKSFAVGGVTSYASAGGSATNCGITLGTDTAAIAVNLTVVLPATGGYITAFPFGATQPLSASLNYKAGDILGNMAILKIDQNATNAFKLSVYSTSLVDLVGDIVGFYSRPAITALECTVTSDTNVVLAAGASGSPTAPACPANYTATETQCQGGSFDTYIVGSAAGQCFAINKGTTSSNVVARNRCCRVPGR